MIYKLLFFTFCVFLATCSAPDDKSPPPSSGGNKSGVMARNIAVVSKTFGIPYRLIYGVAYIESRFNVEPASVAYLDKKSGVGASIFENAFGIPSKKLLWEEGDDKKLFDRQLWAYGRFLSTEIAKKNLNLTSNPRSSSEYFDWIIQVAQIHRIFTTHKNVPIVFAKELIEVLNNGFTLQSADGAETLTLAPQSPRIDVGGLDFPDKQALKLDSPPATLSTVAKNFSLATANTGLIENTPKRVKIIHCPFSLSGCLEIQNYRKESDLRLEAHYVIPNAFESDPDGIYLPLEIVRPYKAVTLINDKGNNIVEDEAIVVMLVGRSGWYNEGRRVDVNPSWQTDIQLVAMGRVLNEACRYINELGNANFSDCININDPKNGPIFVTPKGENFYRWGEIPDFDLEVFREYLVHVGGPFSGIDFSFDEGTFFKAGTVSFKLQFPLDSRYLHIEKLARCSNGKTVWKTIYQTSLRSKKSTAVSFDIFDGGPNFNGTHFLRAKVYSNDSLLGWKVGNLFVRNFDETFDLPSVEECR